MDESLAVVAAFVDGERVDAQALGHALERADGRRYLIELVALGAVLDRADAQERPAQRAPRRPARWVAAAAIVVVSLGTGYAAGRAISERAADAARAEATAPPAPTRVIDLTPGVNWQETKGGD